MVNQAHNYSGVFARVFGGVVVEYPVTQQQIRQRDPKTLSTFFPTVEQGDVAPKPYHRTEYRFKLENKVVVVEKVQTPFSINEILEDVLQKARIKDFNAQRALIQDVDPQAFVIVSQLVEAEMMRQLNALVKAERYDSIDSLASFLSSHVEKFRKQAERGLYLRSEIFASLSVYEHAVMTGVKPVPLTDAEIYAELPSVDWGEALTAKYGVAPVAAPAPTPPVAPTPQEEPVAPQEVSDPVMKFLA